ncbi:MAG: lipocalin-like domain-containing protein [Proteobacteria bacterium]|nr:lipocalin-like domain-containing protein [Pseudomonadota bacterium]
MPADPTRERLLGTWTLVAVINTDVASGEKTDFFGPDPVGYIHYAAEGRMMVINVRSDRARPAGATPSAREAAELLRSVVAYGGEYTIEGNEITHHVDISWNESWTGTKQTRIFRFEGDRIHLSTKPSPDPVHGRLSVRTMTFEKIK